MLNKVIISSVNLLFIALFKMPENNFHGKAKVYFSTFKNSSSGPRSPIAYHLSRVTMEGMEASSHGEHTSVKRVILTYPPEDARTE